MSIMPQKIPLSAQLRKKVRQAVRSALKNIRYEDYARLIEKYRREYQFDDSLLYSLGLLYDHAGLQKLGMLISNEDKSWLTATAKQRVTAGKYFGLAEHIFKYLLAKNSNNVYALFRLGVICEIRRNFDKALYFKKRAYRIIKSGKAQKIPLLIGFTYFKMGDKKKAERWFKKDISFYGVGDPSANMNIFLFYFLSDNYKKAFFYVPRIKKILSKIEKSFGKSALKLWRDRIKKVEDEIF